MSDEPNPRFPEGPSDEDIAERLKRVRADLEAMELPELPEDRIPQVGPAPAAPDFEDKFAQLEAKMERVKTQREAAQRTEQKKLASSAESSRGLGVGMSIAYTIIGVPLVGIAIGYAFDSSNGGNTGRSVGALLGSIIGVVGAVIMLNRTQQHRP